MITPSRCYDAFMVRYGYAPHVCVMTVWDMIEAVEDRSVSDDRQIDKITASMDQIDGIWRLSNAAAEAYAILNPTRTDFVLATAHFRSEPLEFSHVPSQHVHR